jgi:predicted nuclease of predicted toxin-antitoxin system
MPSRPTFFVDRSLGSRVVVAALRDAGAAVEAHDAHFQVDTEDAVWIAEVSRKEWVILSKDKRIRRRGDERLAILVAMARVFNLMSGNMTGREMADLLVARLADMEAVCAVHPAPFIFMVGRDGLTCLHPTA